VAKGDLMLDFEANAVGSAPSDFIDPNDEGYSYSWMPRVNWKIVSYAGSKQYEHDGLSDTANLSFRRYKGTGLGTTNGALPTHYMAELDVTPIQTAAGQKRHLGAEIDTNAHTIKAYLDGQLMATLDANTSDVLPRLLTSAPHYFAMRGTGNIVAHDNIRIAPMP